MRTYRNQIIAHLSYTSWLFQEIQVYSIQATNKMESWLHGLLQQSAPASMCCEAHKENISRGGRHWLHRLQVASSRIVENLWRACSWLMAVSRVGLFSMYSVSGAGAVSLMLLMESRNSPGLFLSVCSPDLPGVCVHILHNMEIYVQSGSRLLSLFTEYTHQRHHSKYKVCSLQNFILLQWINYSEIIHVI